MSGFNEKYPEMEEYFSEGKVYDNRKEIIRLLELLEEE